MSKYNLKERLGRVKNSFMGVFLFKVGNVLVGGERGKQQDALSGALKTGDIAPNFELPDATGKLISLKSLLKTGPVVLVWYRGAWCPYCNIELRYYQKLLPEFAAFNTTLVAISPQQPDFSLSVQEKNDLEYPVLSDVDNVVGKEFGIVFPTGKIQGFLHNASKGLDKHNGNKDRELPLPVTYLIQPNGKISYHYIDLDYRNRAEPEEVLQVLRK